MQCNLHKAILVTQNERNAREVSDIIPDARHGAQIVRYLDTIPHLLRVVIRWDVFHLVRQTGAERHQVRRSGLSINIPRDLPLQHFWTRSL